MKKKFGKCAICGKECELTFEHIPPQKACNNSIKKCYYGDIILELVTSKDKMPWELDGFKYTQMQRGVGIYSLCKECNNYTGSKYGDFYCFFTNKTAEFIKNNLEQYLNSEYMHIKFNSFSPLAFIKQVLSMFCSTNINLSNKYRNVKDILLNADSNLNDFDFKISIGMIKNRLISWTGPMNYFDFNGNSRVLSEIITFPFVYIFEYNKNNKTEKLIDITDFLKYNYQEKIMLDMVLPIVERNNPAFPGDYRTKSEIKFDINRG